MARFGSRISVWRDAENEDHLTQTGDIVGTLRYMPPEAFEGRADKRGDIYSLGLTLYELLALKPAFEDKDRHRLIKRVTTEEPARLDKLNHSIPRDLVTIVHKAIDREPARRYPTAGELAADLQRFLDDEPIRARRISVSEAFLALVPSLSGRGGFDGGTGRDLACRDRAFTFAAAHLDGLAREQAQAAENERQARHGRRAKPRNMKRACGNKRRRPRNKRKPISAGGATETAGRRQLRQGPQGGGRLFHHGQREPVAASTGYAAAAPGSVAIGPGILSGLPQAARRRSGHPR